MANLTELQQQIRIFSPNEQDMLSKQDQRGFEVISSDENLKKRGVERVVLAYDELGSISETSSLLLRLHELMNVELVGRELPVFMQHDMRNMLMIIDRPDLDQYIDEFGELFKSVIKEVPNDFSPVELIYVMRQLMENFLREKTNTVTHFDPKVVGHLRQYGTRSINGGPNEIVYASHTNVVASPGEMFASQLSPKQMWPLTAYYGLSSGLDVVYEKLCQRFDGLKDQQGLLPLAFLQALGTRILHPFWDGNGRTFNAALWVQLNQRGYKITTEQMRFLPQLLANTNDALLGRVLTNAPLAYVEGILHLQIALVPPLRADYMTKLGNEIERAIEIGLDPKGPYFQYYEDIADIIDEELKKV